MGKCRGPADGRKRIRSWNDPRPRCTFYLPSFGIPTRCADVEVRTHWVQVEATLRRAAREIHRGVRQYVKHDPRAAIASSDLAIRAYEGQLTETRSARRTRNAALRRVALARSGGRCAACGGNFGALLGGRGWHVLQVHHRKQLAALDEPRWNTADDLAVVCANCHSLIHSDPDSALPVGTLRALLRMSAPTGSGARTAAPSVKDAHARDG